MKIKNIGHKIISVGSTVILPGETQDVKNFDHNPALQTMIDHGFLEIVKSRGGAKNADKGSDKDKADPPAPANNSKDE